MQRCELRARLGEQGPPYNPTTTKFCLNLATCLAFRDDSPGLSRIYDSENFANKLSGSLLPPMQRTNSRSKEDRVFYERMKEAEMGDGRDITSRASTLRCKACFEDGRYAMDETSAPSLFQPSSKFESFRDLRKTLCCFAVGSSGNSDLPGERILSVTSTAGVRKINVTATHISAAAHCWSSSGERPKTLGAEI